MLLALGGRGDVVVHDVVWQIRFPKAVAACLAGASLSVSGLVLQSVFKNPLAGPFVLGVSSGANLGVALVLLAGVGASWGLCLVRRWELLALSFWYCWQPDMFPVRFRF